MYRKEQKEQVKELLKKHDEQGGLNTDQMKHLMRIYARYEK
jgi:hypothetical protein